MYIICDMFPIFDLSIITTTCPTCMLFLLQEQLINQHHLNLLVLQPWSHHRFSNPLPCLLLPCPALPLSPQKATPHRVPWSWRRELPSVGSRWTTSPFSSLFYFLSRSCSPGFMSFTSLSQSDFAFLQLCFSAKPVSVNVFVYGYCTLYAHATQALLKW